MKLPQTAEIELIPSSPFCFDATFYNPDHFPTSDTRWETGKRWQTMLWQGERLGLIVQNSGTPGSPRIITRIYCANHLTREFLEELSQELIWRFNLNLDLQGFYELSAREPILKDAVARFNGLRPMHPGSLYEFLMIAIVLQNATVRRSVQMMQMLFERYGSLLEYDDQQFWCFWQPVALAGADEQELRRLKVGYRARSLIRVSLPFGRNELDEFALRNKPAAEQERRLLSLYGIGPASVGYVMFSVFHRWEYLKHISPWEQKIYTRVFFGKDYETALVPVGEMLRYFERWGKWKNLAIHYVWQDLWWKRRSEHIPWLEQLIRL